MRKKEKTELVNYRFPTSIKRWLKRKSKRSGRSQTKLVLNAIVRTYALKGPVA